MFSRPCAANGPCAPRVAAERYALPPEVTLNARLAPGGTSRGYARVRPGASAGALEGAPHHRTARGPARLAAAAGPVPVQRRPAGAAPVRPRGAPGGLLALRGARHGPGPS